MAIYFSAFGWGLFMDPHHLDQSPSSCGLSWYETRHPSSPGAWQWHIGRCMVQLDRGCVEARGWPVLEVYRRPAVKAAHSPSI